MFEVPRHDGRLKNKAEVLGLLLEPAGAASAPPRALAVSAEFLHRNPIHHLAFAGHFLVVVTSTDGANRAYATDGRRFEMARSRAELTDESGGLWTLSEESLRHASPAAEPSSFPRLPARRAFWFGWQAQFPDTELVR